MEEQRQHELEGEDRYEVYEEPAEEVSFKDEPPVCDQHRFFVVAAGALEDNVQEKEEVDYIINLPPYRIIIIYKHHDKGEYRECVNHHDRIKLLPCGIKSFSWMN